MRDETWQQKRALHQRFASTTLGAAFVKFENLHGRAWQLDSQEHLSDATLRKAWDACGTAREQLMALLIPIALAGEGVKIEGEK